jgi:hypothetical protein
MNGANKAHHPALAGGGRRAQPDVDWRVKQPVAGPAETNSPHSPTSVGIGQICFSAAGLIPHIRNLIPTAGRNQRNILRRAAGSIINHTNQKDDH